MTHRISTIVLFAGSGTFNHFNVLATCPAGRVYRVKQLRVWTNGSLPAGGELGLDAGGASPAVGILPFILDGQWRQWDKAGDWFMGPGDRLYLNVGGSGVFASLRISGISYPV